MTLQGELRDARLWVPLLTHYRDADAGVAVDLDRTAAHVRALRPDIRGFLLAGSTGDGWEMTDEQFSAILRLAERRDALDSRCGFLVGCLTNTTDGVIARAREVEAWAASATPAARFLGLTICPPVQKDATQDAILGHFDAVLSATSSPVAVYQLPQITQCEVTAESLRTLTGTGRVFMFKDTSGQDRVTEAGFADPRVRMLRGAEGAYAAALKPSGGYDGWLLSSANAFAADLRAVVAHLDAGDRAGAVARSDAIEGVVADLFQAAAGLAFGNPFSNANRAGDHLRAHGAACRAAAPPLTASGNRLPADLLATAEALVARLGALPAEGYLAAA